MSEALHRATLLSLRQICRVWSSTSANCHLYSTTSGTHGVLDNDMMARQGVSGQ